MKRILIRSGKSPFQVATAEQFIQQDLMGTNSGNLLFSDAAHKILLAPNTEVVSNGIRTDSSAKRAAQINAEYDAFVVPLANAFRPSFVQSLDRLSKLVEQLTIPVVVLGVGAQAGADYDAERLHSFDPSVKRFMKAVLKRSASVGVRGEFTADYLKGMGFKDVDIIGCPSMFLHGDTFPELSNRGSLGADSRLAINVSSAAVRVGEIAAITRKTYERYPNLMYYAQNHTDAELLFWGDTSVARDAHSDMPDLRTHPLMRDNRVRVPLDPVTWMSELAEFDFAFGTRIHGNIAALLAGTPSVVLCHDSRTLELCRYFDIPHQMLQDLPADIDPAELYEKADFSGLVNGHQERFQRFTDFLDKNGLENTFTHGDKGASYDARLAALEFPSSIQVWDGSDDGSLGYRIASLRGHLKQVKRNHATALERVDELAAQNGELRELAENLQKRTAALEKKVKGVEGRFTMRLAPALRRRARRALGK